MRFKLEGRFTVSRMGADWCFMGNYFKPSLKEITLCFKSLSNIPVEIPIVQQPFGEGLTNYP